MLSLQVQYTEEDEDLSASIDRIQLHQKPLGEHFLFEDYICKEKCFTLLTVLRSVRLMAGESRQWG